MGKKNEDEECDSEEEKEDAAVQRRASGPSKDRGGGASPRGERGGKMREKRKERKTQEDEELKQVEEEEEEETSFWTRWFSCMNCCAGSQVAPKTQILPAHAMAQDTDGPDSPKKKGKASTFKDASENKLKPTFKTRTPDPLSNFCPVSASIQAERAHFAVDPNSDEAWWSSVDEAWFEIDLRSLCNIMQVTIQWYGGCHPQRVVLLARAGKADQWQVMGNGGEDVEDGKAEAIEGTEDTRSVLSGWEMRTKEIRLQMEGGRAYAGQPGMRLGIRSFLIEGHRDGTVLFEGNVSADMQLMRYAFSGNVEGLRDCLKLGADPTIDTGPCGLYAIFLSACSGEPKAVLEILSGDVTGQARQDLEQRVVPGTAHGTVTCLMAAAILGHLPVVDCLIFEVGLEPKCLQQAIDPQGVLTEGERWLAFLPEILAPVDARPLCSIDDHATCGVSLVGVATDALPRDEEFEKARNTRLVVRNHFRSLFDMDAGNDKGKKGKAAPKRGSILGPGANKAASGPIAQYELKAINSVKRGGRQLGSIIATTIEETQAEATGTGNPRMSMIGSALKAWESELAVKSGEVWDPLMEEEIANRVDRCVKGLKQVKIFGRLQMDDLRKLALGVREIELKQGHVIGKFGEAVAGCYIIVNGEAHYMNPKDSNGGLGETRVATEKTYIVFGELSLAKDCKWPANIKISSPAANCLHITRKAFEAEFMTMPEVRAMQHKETFVRSIGILSILDPAVKRKLAVDILETFEKKRDEVACHQKSHADGLLALANGKVEMRKGHSESEVYMGTLEVANDQPAILIGNDDPLMMHGCIRESSLYVQSETAKFYSLSRAGVEQEVGPLSRLQKSFEQRGIVMRIPTFKLFSQEELLDLVSLFQMKTEPTDMILCRQGLVEEYFFVLLEGRVLKSYPKTGDHPSTIEGSLKEVVTFGDEALAKVKDTERKATVTCITGCRMLVICRDDIEDRFGNLGELLDKRERMLNRKEVAAPKEKDRRERPKEKTLEQSRTECVQERKGLDKFMGLQDDLGGLLKEDTGANFKLKKHDINRGDVYCSAAFGPGLTSEAAKDYMNQVTTKTAGVEGAFSQAEMKARVEARTKARNDIDTAPKLSPRNNSNGRQLRSRKTEEDEPEPVKSKKPAHDGPAVEIEDLNDAVVYETAEKDKLKAWKDKKARKNQVASRFREPAEED